MLNMLVYLLQITLINSYWMFENNTGGIIHNYQDEIATRVAIMLLVKSTFQIIIP